MPKNSKVTFKTYLNDRLKEVSLHGKKTYPLYVQVTFERRTIIFKSYYFELFSKPRYFLSVAGLEKGPSLEEIRAKENDVIEFIVSKHQDDFSLELFKQEYAYYSTDMCDYSEAGFIDYLYTFFNDKGMPALAEALKEGIKFRIAYNVIMEMKTALTKRIYDELIENSLHYASPYLAVYGFMLQTKKWPMLSLSVMEWEKGSTKVDFLKYLTKHYPDSDASQINKQIGTLLRTLKTN